MRLSTLLTIAALSSLARYAEAEPTPAVDDRARAAARTLGYDGVSAFERGDYPSALEKLQKAYAIVHIHTLGLWSARAMVKRGLLVEAGERYLEVVRTPVLQGDAAIQADARESAAHEREALLPKIPTLRVIVDGQPAKDVRISVDKEPIQPALLTIAFGVNPGSHEIEVRGRGPAAVATKPLTLVEGAHETLRFVLPPAPLEADAPASRDRAEEASKQARSTRLTGAATLGGAGLVSLVVGAVAGGVAASKWSAAETACPALTACPSNEGNTLARAARPPAAVANVAFAVGATALAGATVLWLSAPSAPRAPKLGLGPAGIVARGSF